MLARTELDECSQDILGVAAFLDKHGWCQHSFETDDGRMCLAGAITRYLIRKQKCERLDARMMAIFRRLRLLRGPIDWNDEPGRTKEQVIELLHNAAYAEVLK